MLMPVAYKSHMYVPERKIGAYAAIGKELDFKRIFLMVIPLKEDKREIYIIPTPPDGLSEKDVVSRSSCERCWEVKEFKHLLVKWWKKYFLLSYKNSVLVEAQRVNTFPGGTFVFDKNGRYLTILEKGFITQE